MVYVCIENYSFVKYLYLPWISVAKCIRRVLFVFLFLLKKVLVLEVFE